MSKVFPAYFYSKAPIKTSIQPLDFGDGLLHWMKVVESDEDCQRSRQSQGYAHRALAPYEDNEDGMIDCGDLEETYDIVITKSGKFMTSFYVPSALHAVIIGPKGSQLKQLQENTGALIKVPKPGEHGDVKVTGHNERSVASARNQIAMIILNKREKMAVTHFISIPVISPGITENFKKFKEEILTGPPTRGVDESIFQRPEKFHLTITTLTLLDDKEVQDARDTLNNCYKEVISPLFPKGKKYQITMRGIEIMNDDPSDVDVLYGKVKLDSSQGTENFQIMANEIANYFYRKGLIRKQYDNVKLHITLMNSLFRKKCDNYERPEERSKRESFDATYILETFKNYYFGECTFENIQLSIRFSTGDDNYYQSALTIPIQ